MAPSSDRSRSAPLPSPSAAYIHVPFCAHRCGYCDFTVTVGREHQAQDYLRALERELRSLGEPRLLATLFIGGGTPTHLNFDELDRLLALVTRWFPVSPDLEFSVEANPAGLGEDKIACLAAHGVNRVSLGVQAFDAAILHTLERDHDAATVASVVSRLAPRIPNFSIDLIFGVPGQTLAGWREALAQAIALQPQHISTYGLTIEKGTAFWSRRARGTLVPVDDELERAMYAAAMDDLATAGFEQYELSNFARPGFRCRHNETYWAGLPYYGFGPGAARYLHGRRETNHRSFTTWLARITAGKSPTAEIDDLAPIDRARETLIVGLRRAAGVDATAFRELTGFDLEEIAGPALARHVAHGLLERTPQGIRLTREGRFLADTVIVDCL